MIGQLDQVIKPVEQVSAEPIPVGEYNVKVVKIDDWKKQTKTNVKVNVKDDKGFVLKDDKGKNVTQLHPELIYYTADIVFEILEGPFKGRKIYETLTTHPNALFITEGFLFAVEKTLSAKDIPTKCIGDVLKVKTKIDTYEKIVTDKQTGFENKEIKSNTRVDKYLKTDFVAPQAVEEENLGI